MFVMYTLDSHDYLGPFVSERAVHNYAKDHGFTSYSIIHLLNSGDTMEYDPE